MHFIFGDIYVVKRDACSCGPPIRVEKIEGCRKVHDVYLTVSLMVLVLFGTRDAYCSSFCFQYCSLHYMVLPYFIALLH